jgi:hypothetical protein
VTRSSRGSAIVETALACLIGSALLAGSLFIARVSLSARRAHALARHAASLSAAGVPAGIIDGEVSDYAARLADRSALSWSVGRYVGSASAAFYRLMEAAVSADIVLPPLVGGGHHVIRERAVVEEDRT